MEKLIIVAGAPNVGKTESTNLVIKKLINDGFILKYLENPTDGSETNFWEKFNRNGKPLGGTALLEKDLLKIAVITFGDEVNSIEKSFKSQEVQSCQIVVCCSHATRGKKVFEYFHNFIKDEIDLNEVKIIPIFKNLLCNYGKNLIENEQTADLVIKNMFN